MDRIWLCWYAESAAADHGFIVCIVEGSKTGFRKCENREKEDEDGIFGVYASMG